MQRKIRTTKKYKRKRYTIKGQENTNELTQTQQRKKYKHIVRIMTKKERTQKTELSITGSLLKKGV